MGGKRFLCLTTLRFFAIISKYGNGKEEEDVLQIPIDDERYHGNVLTEAERAWGQRTLTALLARYKGLSAFIDGALSALHLSQVQRTALLTDVTLAFSHYAKVAFPPRSEAELYARLKKWFHAFLPYIAENVSLLHTSYLIQYEPIALTNIYISNSLYRALTETSFSEDEDRLALWVMHEWVGYLRTLRAIMLLISLGDDAHAMGLLRGAFEIGAKLRLADRYPTEYLLFKKFNIYLQDHKLNKAPIPTEMKEYLAREPLYKRNKESFLAYGWARDAAGERILTMTGLLEASFFESCESVLQFFHMTSEFVHEDYVGVGYDYIAIRRYITDLCFWMYRLLLDDEELTPFFPSRERSRVCHLLTLATPCYAGEFPLEEAEAPPPRKDKHADKYGGAPKGARP